MQFDEFAASEPEAGTAQPMSDQDIVKIFLTENDAQEESDDESEEEIPSVSAIKTSVEFLSMIDQQKAFLKRNEMPTDIVEQLETQVVAMQFSFSLCQRRQRWCLRLLRNTVCRVQISCRRCGRYSVLCIQWPLALPGGKACCSRPSCGLSGSPPCSPRRQLCLKMFWDLPNYKGDCRQDAQPIPNS